MTANILAKSISVFSYIVLIAILVFILIMLSPIREQFVNSSTDVISNAILYFTNVTDKDGSNIRYFEYINKYKLK